MRLFSWDAASKATFVLSLCVLAFLYGVAARAWNLFPHPLVDEAWDQARPFAENLIPDWWPESRDAFKYEGEGIQILEPEKIQSGLTLVSVTRKGQPLLLLINMKGTVLHEWSLNPAEIFPERFISFLGINQYAPLGVATLQPNGDLLVKVSHGPAAHVDACGEVHWRLDGNFHHQASRGLDGSYWLITETRDTPDYPGLRERDLKRAIQHNYRSVRHDHLVHVSQGGEVLSQISLLEVLFENGLQRQIAKVLEWTNDLTHANDVEPLPASLADEHPLFETGDLLVSLRTPNLVLVMDPRSQRVKWYANKPFLRQHDPDFLGGGWIGLFDNRWDGTVRGNMLSGSRILAIQPHTDSVKVLFPTPKSDHRVYTPTGGRWKRLRNGNLLIHESVPGRILEVTADGQTVWEYLHSSGDGTGDIPMRGGGRRYYYSPERVRSWPCSPDDSPSTSAQGAR